MKHFKVTQMVVRLGLCGNRIGHHAYLRERDDFFTLSRLASKKICNASSVRALVLGQITHAQLLCTVSMCNVHCCKNDKMIGCG